jgi:phospholipase/carboxylesterase
MSGLLIAERPAAGEPDGLLVLHHGRGADEQDLLRLGAALDPERRLHLITPRAPLQPAGALGYHWYLVPRVGHPDPASFRAAFAALAALHDELWERTGIGPERTILGGFSMGAVMSYALGLPAERPAPAGILAFSGFVPTVPGWQADLAGRPGLDVFIAHGERDPVIDVSFGRDAAETLRDGGARVEYHEAPIGHHIDPRQIPLAAAWVAARIPAATPEA